MEDIYLSPDRKAAYMVDFKNLISFNKDDFWKLSPELVPFLKRINKNKSIQSLYSKLKNPDEANKSSYLTFAYTEETEMQLFRIIIPELLHQFNAKFDQTCTYLWQAPRDNANSHNGNSNKGIGCIDNPDHFRINIIKLLYDSSNYQNHLLFWEKLTYRLENIGA